MVWLMSGFFLHMDQSRKIKGTKMDVELKNYICIYSSLRSKNCSEIREMDEVEE